MRGGSIVGDHEVLFCGPDEVITLRHTAYSRSIFANGAVNAAVYLAKKEPGLYDMGRPDRRLLKNELPRHTLGEEVNDEAGAFKAAASGCP